MAIHIRIKNIFFVFVVLMVFGRYCWGSEDSQTPEELPRKESEARMQYRKLFLEAIDTTDGIDEMEAKLLGSYYLKFFISSLSLIGLVFDKADHWEVEMYVGYPSKSLNDNVVVDKQRGNISTGIGYDFKRLKNNILIDKQSGKISTGLVNLPTFNSPKEMFDFDATSPDIPILPEEWVE